MSDNIFFTADLHFHHRNIITYCNRPFNNVAEMNAYLIQTWNSQVDVNDIVYFLGDFSINKKAVFDESLVRQLNGIKHLILGNHDKFTQEKNRYITAGWSSVQTQIHQFPLKNGIRINMIHHPPVNNSNNRNHIYLHGHSHCRYLKKGNCIDVGIDNKLSLYTEDDIITIIKEEKNYIPSRLEEFYSKLQ